MALPPDPAPGEFIPPWEDRQDWHAHGPGEGKRARKALIFAAMAVGCVLIGINLVFFPPIFLFGALFGIGAAVLVLARPFWGLILYAALFLLRPGEIYPSLAGLHIERVVGLVTLVALFVSMYRREGRLVLDGSRQSQLLLLLVAALFVSIPFSYWPGRSMERVVDFLKIVAFYIMIVQLVDTRTRLRVFVGTYMIMIAVIGFGSLKAFFAGELMFAQGIERAIGVTSAGGDPNSLGATLATTVPLLLMAARSVRRPGIRWFLFALVGLLMWTIALTGSRSAMLGLTTSLVVVWWFTRHRFLVAVFGLLIISAAFISLPESYKERYASIAHHKLDASSKLRITTWEAGARMILDRPLLGVGVGAFGTAHHLEGSWLEAHSLYIQVPAETGLIGAAIYASFLIAFLRINRRARRLIEKERDGWDTEAAILDGVLAGACGLFVYSIFGHTMLRFTWYVFAALSLVVYRMHLDLPRDQGDPERITGPNS